MSHTTPWSEAWRVRIPPGGLLLSCVLPQPPPHWPHPASSQALENSALPEELKAKKLLATTWGSPEVILDQELYRGVKF